MHESFGNTESDALYKENLPKQQVFERKIKMTIDLGPVSIYTSLEVNEIDAMLHTGSAYSLGVEAGDKLRNLQKIEKAIGFTALQDLIEKHQESVVDKMSLDEVEPFSEEERVLRQKLDSEFIDTHLVFSRLSER